MTKRIFRAISLAAFAVLFASLSLIMGFLYTYFTKVQQSQLRSETALTAHAVANEGSGYFDQLDNPGCRITWIAADGTVLYDSASQPAQMENHMAREEFRQALDSGYGESIRYSSTLMERSLYCAQRLPDGTVLRLSMSQNSILTLVLGMAQPICVIVVIAIVLSLILASRSAKRIVKPLNELNLDNPLSNEDYDELSPLLRRIDSQQKQLRYQAQELTRKKTEFDAVTGSMSEGLVLLNGKGLILSMNPAAAGQLSLSLRQTGKDFLSIVCNSGVQETVRTALFGQHAEKTVQLSNGNYQVDASPVLTEGTVSGVVLLLIDVTEKLKAESLRREFTANVSHELKTPLHAISGYAELLKSGMVQPEDVPQFSEKIYGETQRLIQLVEDIIRLSRLDEGSEDLKPEPVDLYALAAEVMGNQQDQAAQAQLTLSLEGQHATISGFPQQLLAIISNLCSNAIKYNRPGGWVRVSVVESDTAVSLSVADSGIGIPAQHQQRVFERFYRVDKSHSKAVGGTGLGLSIVKHAALLHHAKVELVSTPGEGTTVTVRFPK